MKPHLILALSLLLSANLLAQEPANETEPQEKTEKSTAVPSTIDFQGRLHDSDGNPVNATLNITFSLYDVLSGGTAMWTETKSVQIVDGLFQVKLGETNPVDPGHFSDPDRWLGIKVGAEAEMSPRTKISSVGYAMQSEGASNIWTISENDIYYDAGKVGIGINAPTALLHVHGNETGGGNVLFAGEFKETDPGDPPAIGEGTRMMWYPDKAAFRAGTVDGNQWDKENIGNHSFAAGIGTVAKVSFSTAMGIFTSALGVGSTAMGGSTIASGGGSTAMGEGTIASEAWSTALGYMSTASGVISTAMGSLTTASGRQSTAMGHNTTASGWNSTAMTSNSIASGWCSTALGYMSTASGHLSTAMGRATIASSENSTAIGRFNIGGGNPDSWIETDPLFEIGNGISGDERQNALTVLKNGDMGIGTHTPTALFHTHGTDPGKGNVLFVGEYKKTNPGDPPTEGSGTRMMWYPDKGAFRAGVVEGNQWDKENIGDYSLAAGFLTMASGEASFAMGAAASASGNISTALGYYASAPGDNSTAIGLSTTAASYASLAVGRSNVGGGDANNWIETDPLFEIGNGTFEQPRNALTVLKNGKTGIGTTAPPARLSIQGAGSNPTLPGVASSGVLRIGILFNEGIDIGKLTAAPHTGWIQSGSDGTFADPLSLQPLGGNLGIGTTSPTQALDVNGQIRIRGGSPGNGKVLTSDANGVATWTTPGISLPFSGSTSAGTYGISIDHTAASGTTIAGIFTSNSTSGTGVKGVASATSGTNYGGYFTSASTTGYGVLGQSPKFGVFGKSTGNQGRALTGEATGTASIGVRGVALNDNSTGVWGEGSNYDFYANGPGVDYGSGSSIRWKRNIIAIPDPLAKIASLRGVYFDWDEEHGGRHDIGMIAEEVGKVIPEIVIYEENGIDAMGMDYSKIGPLLVEAVKALKSENDRLKQDNLEVNARLERLERALESLSEK